MPGASRFFGDHRSSGKVNVRGVISGQGNSFDDVYADMAYKEPPMKLESTMADWV